MCSRSVLLSLCFLCCTCVMRNSYIVKYQRRYLLVIFCSLYCACFSFDALTVPLFALNRDLTIASITTCRSCFRKPIPSITTARNTIQQRSEERGRERALSSDSWTSASLTTSTQWLFRYGPKSIRMKMECS